MKIMRVTNQADIPLAINRIETRMNRLFRGDINSFMALIEDDGCHLIVSLLLFYLA